MATRTIQVSDVLEESVTDAITDLKDAIVNYVNDNQDIDDLDLSNDINYNGTLDEIVDSATPIYCSDIDGTYYLHADKLDEAYDNAGIYSERPENYRQIAIYLYISQECWEWFSKQEFDFDEWRESGKDFDAYMTDNWND